MPKFAIFGNYRLGNELSLPGESWKGVKSILYSLLCQEGNGSHSRPHLVAFYDMQGEVLLPRSCTCTLTSIQKPGLVSFFPWSGKNHGNFRKGKKRVGRNGKPPVFSSASRKAVEFSNADLSICLSIRQEWGGVNLSNASVTFLSPAAPKARDGRYCNAPRPSVCLSVRRSVCLSVTFSFRTVTQKRIAVFSRNFAGTCTKSWGCAV